MCWRRNLCYEWFTKLRWWRQMFSWWKNRNYDQRSLPCQTLFNTSETLIWLLHHLFHYMQFLFFIQLDFYDEMTIKMYVEFWLKVFFFHQSSSFQVYSSVLCLYFEVSGIYDKKKHTRCSPSLCSQKKKKKVKVQIQIFSVHHKFLLKYPPVEHQPWPTGSWKALGQNISQADQTSKAGIKDVVVC